MSLSAGRLQNLGLAVAALLLAGCAETSSTIHARPSLAAGSGAGYAEFSRDQEEELLGNDESAEAEKQIVENADLVAILRIVLDRNPGILAARARWKAAIERVPQATALPDPSVSVLHFLESVETRTGPQENVFTLTQKIPWPGKLSAAGDVASERAKIASIRYSATVRDVIVAVKTAYYEYAYLTRAKVIVHQNIGIANRLAALGSDLYAEDKALLIDVLKAQSQLAQIEYDLITLTELISAETTRLNGLMDRPPEAPLGPTGVVPFPRLILRAEELYELAARNREELQIADAQMEEARAREALALAQYAPDITIGGTYIGIGKNRAPLPVAPDNGDDAYGIMVGITIPLWMNRTSAGVREARALQSAAIQGKIQAWNMTFTALKDAYFRLTNAERLVLLYRDNLIPQAEQVMLSTEERAREDRMRLGDYLEAQTVWLNFTLAQERARVDYNQALAQLERLTGASLAPKAGGEE